jgi:hypothetical protein
MRESKISLLSLDRCVHFVERAISSKVIRRDFVGVDNYLLARF